MKKCYYVYILISKKHGVIYSGVTDNLIRRVFEHKVAKIDGFTKKYHVNKLVYYETYQNVIDAISREKCIKRWKRSWKIRLIEKENPSWKDIYGEII